MLARRLSDIGRSLGRLFFRMIVQVPLATSYVSSVRSEIRNGCDNSQKIPFHVFGKEMQCIQIRQTVKSIIYKQKYFFNNSKTIQSKRTQ